MTLYLDSSAIVKLVQREAESDALRRYLRRHRIGMIRLARRQLARLYLVPLHRNLLDEAAEMGDVVLRSLDAVHLASAAQLGAHLRAVVTYDTRMQTAAARLHRGQARAVSAAAIEYRRLTRYQQQNRLPRGSAQRWPS